MKVRPAVVAAVAVLACPSLASAATIRGKRGEIDDTIRYRASEDIANRLMIERLGRGRALIRERSEELHAKGACVQVDTHTARCPSGFLDPIRVVLGNGADRVKVETDAEVQLYAGSGADRVLARGTDIYTHGMRGADVLEGRRLFAGDGDDRLVSSGAFGGDLWGGPGNDVIRGRRRDDSLHGGPGRDRLFGGKGPDFLSDWESDDEAASDIFDGGGGYDRVAYFKRQGPVHLDLMARGVDTTGEDFIRNVETLAGGAGDDVLSGREKRDRLWGMGGDDRIAGRGGGDNLRGRRGNDVVDGGEGNDKLFGDEGEDRILGGGGSDVVVGIEVDELTDIFGRVPDYPPRPDHLMCGDGEDLIRAEVVDRPSGCEQADSRIGNLAVGVEPTLGNGEAVFTVTWDEYEDCATSILLTRATSGVVFGSGTAESQRDPATHRCPSSDLSVPLNAEGRAALREGVVVQVEINPVENGSRRSTGYRLFIRGDAGE